MATKKDLIEAQGFSRRRLLSAFTSGAPGGKELEPAAPLRAVLAGVVLSAMVILAGVFYGLLRPGLPAGWEDNTLAEAQKWANDPAKDFTLEPSAPGTGVREWLDSLTDSPRFFAAFDTRVDIARILSGAASGGIDYRLSQRGGHRLVPASSFLVAKDGRLENGELRRATLWSAVLGDAIAALKVSH